MGVKGKCGFLLYILEVGEMLNVRVGGSLLKSVPILRSNHHFAMIYLSK